MWKIDWAALYATGMLQVVLSFVVLVIAIGILYSVWTHHHQDACWHPSVKTVQISRVDRVLNWWLYSEIALTVLVVAGLLWLIWGPVLVVWQVLLVELLVVGVLASERKRKAGWNEVRVLLPVPATEAVRQSA